MYSTCILAECVVSQSVDDVEDYWTHGNYSLLKKTRIEMLGSSPLGVVISVELMLWSSIDI
jgi:hypothetical protein